MQLTPILTLIVQVGLIITVCRLMGMLFARFRQPQALGEMIAGLMLGPSVLGSELHRDLFPGGSTEVLGLLSQLGLIFFLFLIGLELDPRLLRARGRISLRVSLASLLISFGLGCGLGAIIYGSLGAPGFGRSTADSVMFLGAAMTMASFPVIARILTERNLHRSELGILAIACGAFNDLAAWCILAAVIAFAGMKSASQTALIIWLTAIFVIAMLYVVRPFLSRLEIIYDRGGRLSQNVVAIVFLLILASAYAAAASGTHALFGAFLLGWVMPKGTPFVRHLSEKFEDYTIVFLLPIFFAVTGFQADLRGIFTQGLWGWAALVVLVGIAGKLGAAAIAARGAGLAWRESAAVGLVLNTRGVMALVVAGVGLEMGLMSKPVYAMMVIMTLITTAMTTPLLDWILPRRLAGVATPTASENTDESPAESAGPPRGMSIVIPVSLPKSGGPLVQLLTAGKS